MLSWLRSRRAGQILSRARSRGAIGGGRGTGGAGKARRGRSRRTSWGHGAELPSLTPFDPRRVDRMPGRGGSRDGEPNGESLPTSAKHAALRPHLTSRLTNSALEPAARAVATARPKVWGAGESWAGAWAAPATGQCLHHTRRPDARRRTHASAPRLAHGGARGQTPRLRTRTRAGEQGCEPAPHDRARSPARTGVAPRRTWRLRGAMPTGETPRRRR